MLSWRVLLGQALYRWRLVFVQRRSSYREVPSLFPRSRSLPTTSSTVDSRSRLTFATSVAQNDGGSRGRSPQTVETMGHIRKDRVVIERNVRYAKDHPRNVMDIYTPASTTSSGTDRPPVLLFVHGGMWLRGSKEQHSLSMYDVVSTMLASAYDHMLSTRGDTMEEKTKQQDPTFSNIGLTVAGNGGVACIMNYRLAAQQSPSNGELMEEDVAHPHQVMDVARAIAFMVERELSQTSGHSQDPPNLYIGGHSAGAHLAALALSDPRYLHAVMDERRLDWSVLSQVLAGFIGISGVYNLRRLVMSPMADITVGPAFFGKDHRYGEEGFDMSLEASPVHALLRAQDSFHGERTQQNWLDEYPPLVGLPVLLLNAESDFHLHQDASELLVALRHFKDRQKGSTQSFDKKFEDTKARSDPIIIAGRNHLSIMREFGQGLIPSGVEHPIIDEGRMDTDIPPKHVLSGDNKSSMLEGWTVNRLVNDSIDVFSSTTSFLSSYVMHDDQPDETASRVLEFLRLGPTSPRPPARKC